MAISVLKNIKSIPPQNSPPLGLASPPVGRNNNPPPTPKFVECQPSLNGKAKMRPSSLQEASATGNKNSKCQKSLMTYFKLP